MMAELRAFVKDWGDMKLPQEAKELERIGWQLVAGDCLTGDDQRPYVVWILRQPPLIRDGDGMISIRLVRHYRTQGKLYYPGDTVKINPKIATELVTQGFGIIAEVEADTKGHADRMGVL
ncbi:MAG TPA: hypothetical protein VMW24_24600 [Sedimentisphaerales bacterium]|nr:hypothetical protein [Sedimentisphaerales bacterium]